jgi:Phage integrase, N-terminal SAM-like domain
MPLMFMASTWEVGMGLAEEDRATARSDEPEARTAARWRERATSGAPEDIAERWPALASRSIALRWLALQVDSGRSPRTVQAYARSLVDYLAWCDRGGVEVETAGRAEIAGYLRDLRERPGRHGANVVSLNSGVGLSNATLQLRVTVVRLFYDFLVEEQVRDRNPVARGYRSAMAGLAGGVWSPGSIRCRGSRPTRSGARSWTWRSGTRCGTG